MTQTAQCLPTAKWIFCFCDMCLAGQPHSAQGCPYSGLLAEGAASDWGTTALRAEGREACDSASSLIQKPHRLGSPAGSVGGGCNP